MISEKCRKRSPIPTVIGTAEAPCAGSIMDPPLGLTKHYALGDVLPPWILLHLPTGT